MQVKKILLVEDDLDIRENMSMVLQYEKYQVEEAEHGKHALEILEDDKKNRPDIILLDLFMPVMNGREFLDAIDIHPNRHLKNIPVILITASEQVGREDLDARTTAVLRKPLDLKIFLSLLKSISEEREVQPLKTAL